MQPGSAREGVVETHGAERLTRRKHMLPRRAEFVYPDPRF